MPPRAGTYGSAISPAAQRAHSSCIAVSRRTIDQAAGTVREEQFDARDCEFPRIDDRLVGLPARHGYTSTMHGSDGGAIHCYDLRQGAVTSHQFGEGQVPGEAIGS
ncbi:MAG TPA: carotenoid oxygenase family protein [Trebonia sp.]